MMNYSQALDTLSVYKIEKHISEEYESFLT